MNAISGTPPSLRAAAGAQEPVTFIDANGVRLAAMRRGRGIPIVCLHAIAHGARDFEDLATRLGDEFEIIAIDWPGQGRSPSDGEPASAARYAKILESALTAFGVERPILLGNSIGGAAALQAAAAAPHRYRALVLCNSGGLSAVGPFARFLIERFVAFFRAGEEGKRWFGPAYNLYYRRVLREPPAAAQRARIIAAGYENAAPLRTAWQSFARPEADTRALAAKVTCPVWLAWAKDDAILAWSGVKDAAAKFPLHKATLFKGGHSAFLEDPERFAAEFKSFVREFVG